MKRVLALLLALIIVVSCGTVCAYAVDTDTLRFGADGKFKIVVFADTQDTDNPNKTMIDFIGYALDREQPDLVVFTGDNVVVDSESRFRVGAQKLLQPLIDRNVPYAYTFGNHDAEKVDKVFMHSVYKSLGRCLTYNADNSIFGYGNCNIPIYASNSNEMKFNLWMIDSNMYPTSGSGYDNVHTDQLEWFKRTDEAIEASVGHKVNSLMFQHIALPEIYNCLKSGVAKFYNGKGYKLELNESAHGTLGEFPCPPKKNSGQFDVIKSRGDVIGVVTGHDHKNSFVGTYQGIDFIQFPGMTFHSYGDSNVRGYGVIELNESNTSTYTSRTRRYIDADDTSVGNRIGGSNDYYRYNNGTFISEVKCAQNSRSSSAIKSLESSGYEVIDFDLNTGAGGKYIYMGYKTTTDPEAAIKDLCFYSESGDAAWTKFTMKVNGKDCEYFRDDGADLNKGSGGDYIYACYTKDSHAGAPITSISFSTDTNGDGRVCGKYLTPDVPADLNKGTTKHENAIYCFTKTNAEIITDEIISVKNKYSQLKKYLNADGFSESSKAEFTAKMQAANNFLTAIEDSRVTALSDFSIQAFKNDIMDSCALLSSCVNDGMYLYGISSATAPDSLAGRFSNYVSVSVNPSGKYLGTGSTVTLNYDGMEKVLETVTFGDINGDGWYDGQDATVAACIKNGLTSYEQVGGAAYTAADCNHDGQIDDADIETMNQAGILLADIDQTKSNDELLTSSSVYGEYVLLIDQFPEIEAPSADEPVLVEPDVDRGFAVGIYSMIISFIKRIADIVFRLRVFCL